MSTSINPDLKVRLKTAAVLVLSFLIITAFAKYSSIGAMAFTSIVYLLIVVAAFEFSRLPEDQSKLLLLSRFALLIYQPHLFLALR